MNERGLAVGSFIRACAMALHQAVQVCARYLVARLSVRGRRVGAAMTGTPARMRVLQVSARKTIVRATAMMWQRWYYAQTYASRWMALYRAPTALAALLVGATLSAAASGTLQHILDPYVASSDGIATLRTAIVTLGGAFVG